jgi:hypothetical protein
VNDFHDLDLGDLHPDDVYDDELDHDDDDADPETIGAGEHAPAPQRYYPTLDAFVHEYLIGTYRRNIDGRHRNWCPQWWCHVEAIARLEAMWRSFEHLRTDPASGTSVWFINHADPHMAVLLDPTGPFQYCGPEKGHVPRLEPLPAIRPPDGLFAPPLV